MKSTNGHVYKRSILATAIVALAAVLATTVALAIIPANGGMVGGATIVVDDSAGHQTDPHVSGDIAAYTDYATGSGVIHYYDFLNPSASGIIPSSDPFDIDELSDVNGNFIAFSRQHADNSRSCMVFDRTTTASPIEIAPGQEAVAFATALGSDTVAFVNVAVNNGDIMVGKIFDPLAPLVNLSVSSRADSSPAVSPLGDTVVWVSCALINCDVMKSIRSGGTWSAAVAISDTTSSEQNPDTDGVSVTYDSNRAGTLGGSDIFFQALTGGSEIQMELDGLQRNPSISGSVIAFESKAVGEPAWDLFVYQMSTNTLFQVTNTPSTNEILTDVTTLENGDVRVVWAADNDLFPGEHNIYARTFTLPAPPTPTPTPLYNFSGFFPPVDNLPTRNDATAGSSIPVRFSLGGDHGLSIFAAGYPASSPILCDDNELSTAIEETMNVGNSSLNYNSSTDQYSYIWKTNRDWRGTCRMLILKFDDTSQHMAKFKFR